ncbi:MAG: tryptophan synthase subunit alpha [Syntrophales bacterium]|jgi:tryptophan synthase alpha chain|nr:tryptophan synthase subunit alpha [Syntrophales bacterium]
MNRLDERFAALKKKNECALVGFVAFGDPSLEDSLDLVTAMCRAGLDVLELGIPFSDPTADGPVIQRAAGRALKAGATLAGAIGMTKALRKKIDIPIVLFSYYNPVFAYGPERFYRDSQKAGADGVLIVDLPHEESHELTRCWNRDDFALIRLVAPTTPPERMKRIAEDASGFLYLVSKTGVTGSSGIDINSVKNKVNDLHGITHVPVCVGFGISSPADAKALAPYAEGIVIGSAFEKTIEEHLGGNDLTVRLDSQIRDYKASLYSAPLEK